MSTLKQLATFDAAARHLNFTRAADELGLLQPAVSRQISALENDLNTPLFVRSKPRLTLTDDGEALHRAVSAGLGQIQSAVAELRAKSHAQKLHVNATIGLASCYLMRRLPDFAARFPDVDIELHTRDLSRA
ncbi:MAG: LysR family transcriptional regulator [Pseudomonadota bacterium]